MADMKKIQAYQSALSQARNMLDKGNDNTSDKKPIHGSANNVLYQAAYGRICSRFYG